MEFDIGISGLSGEELEGRRRMIESVNVDVFELICCPLSICVVIIILFGLFEIEWRMRESAKTKNYQTKNSITITIYYKKALKINQV